jgi:hypothetical protein
MGGSVGRPRAARYVLGVPAFSCARLAREVTHRWRGYQLVGAKASSESLGSACESWTRVGGSEMVMTHRWAAVTDRAAVKVMSVLRVPAPRGLPRDSSARAGTPMA